MRRSEEKYESVEALRRETAYLLHRLIASIVRKEESEVGQKAQSGLEHQMREGVVQEAASYEVASTELLAAFDTFYPSFSSGPFGPSGPSDPSN